ncbi:redoxin domain-containing protein, partial [Haemophilus influenzae]|uniref:redoxin domain-containing protein n=1 Tax=Haemophilus influenzae TaxID=727 RepID=UPI0013D05123
VKELPEINQFYREAKSRGWQVLGLAVDQAEPVRAFLQKAPLDFAVALAGPQGLGLVREPALQGRGRAPRARRAALSRQALAVRR